MIAPPTTALPRAETPSVPLRYRLLSRLLWPAMLLLSWRQGRTAGDHTLFSQRRARDLPTQPVAIWVHCASVGEINTAAPLIDALLERGHTLALSVITPTGAETARKRFGHRLTVCYLPIDKPGYCRRFLSALKPRIGLIVETEIWPHLFAEAQSLGVALAVVNARLSPRSRNAPAFLRGVQRNAVSRLEHVLARDGEEADAWRNLGAAPERVTVAGNLKYAALSRYATDPPRRCPVRYWLAASTHADEERDIAAAWMTRPERRDCCLVIAPRHVDRAGTIRRELEALGAVVAQHSRGETAGPDTDIVLADTFGEMQSWYAHADAVFVGGSFAPIGGHNLLEPAAFGRWIATGPSLHNFTHEAALLDAADALVRVPDAKVLVERVIGALADTDATRQRGACAREAVTNAADVLPTYLAEIDALYARSKVDHAD